MLDDAARKKISTRLNRVRGQIEGIGRMVDNDAYCVDVLLQISAAQAALGKIGSLVLENHLETCVAQAFQSGDEEERQKKIEEMIDIFGKYGRMRSA